MRNASRASISFGICIALTQISLYSGQARADDFSQRDVQICPVSSTIRVSSSAIAEKFRSLESCGTKHVAGSGTIPASPPPMARIIGVTQIQIQEMEEEERKNAREREDNAPVRTSAILPYDVEIRRAASRYNIDPMFLHAIVATESDYGPSAISPVGARGLMQIMPATGAELGVDEPGLFDPDRNVDAGAGHLKALQSRFGTNLELVLGAYNAGAGAVARHGNRVPPYAETVGYVGKVMGRYRTLLGDQGLAR